MLNVINALASIRACPAGNCQIGNRDAVAIKVSNPGTAWQPGWDATNVKG